MPAVHSEAPLIKRCRQEAVSLSAVLIEHCLDAVRRGLSGKDGAGGMTTRLVVQEALAALDTRRVVIEASFPSVLDQAIAEAVDDVNARASRRAARARSPSLLPGDGGLALLDDSQLLEAVEVSRLVQAVLPTVEHTLARLNTLVSSVLDQPVVRTDLNPMRPDVLCGALMQTLAEQGVATEVRRLWLRHMTRVFARELDGLYAALVALLEGQGVQEAHYRVKLAASSLAGGGLTGALVAAPALSGAPQGRAGGVLMPGAAFPSRGVPTQASGLSLQEHISDAEGISGAEDISDEEAIRRRRAPMPRASDLASLQVNAPLATLREFLNHPQWIERYDAPLPPDYYAAVQRQLAQVAAESAQPCDAAAAQRAQAQWEARTRTLPVVDRPAREMTPDTALSPELWGEQAASPRARMRLAMEIKAQALQMSQALGIDAVRTLVAQVVGDERLLAPVREAVLALEPALLRLALAEPRCLGEGAHPARDFIEEIAQRSFRYNDEFEPEFASFIDPVRQAMRGLNALAGPVGDDFAQRLQALQADWQTQDAAEQQARAQSGASMAFAQERQEMADKIAASFALRSDLVGVPTVVADFLLRDWSLVIAHAQLTDTHGQLDPGGYLSIVTDLLWSVKRDAILLAPARLFDLVPRLLATLRKGLEMLGKEPHESQALFDMLLHFHQPVLALRRMRNNLDQGKSMTSEALSAALKLPMGGQLIQPGEPPKLQAAEEPWLARREREITGFMDSLSDTCSDKSVNATPSSDGAAQGGCEVSPSGVPEVAAEAEAEAEDDSDIQGRVKAQLTRLRCGDKADLHLRQRWCRAELAWVSNNATLYLFISHDGQAYSMTRRTLEKLLRRRHLRPVDAGRVLM